MYLYTTEEKVQIVCWYLTEGTEATLLHFQATFPNRPVPSQNTVRRIFQKFKTKGCVTTCYKCHRSGDVRPMSEERQIREENVCAAVEINDPCSSRQIAETVGLQDRTVRNILKRNHYRSFKLRTTQEIFPDDQLRRLRFCEAMREKADADEFFIFNTLFTDESTFSLYGVHNSQVTRYWSRKNKFLTIPARTQYPQKLNVWAGILGDNIIGPFFIDGNLNANKYLEMLQTQIIPAVRNVRLNLDNVWFQQDGCPAHNARIVRAYLEEIFPNRVISTTSEIPWAPRSPDLAPNDFFLWGHLKSKIYGHAHERPRNLDELRAKIVAALEAITPEVLSNVRREFYDRLGYCEAQQGNIFENLL